MLLLRRLSLLFGTVLALMLCVGARAQPLVPVPTLTERVIDQTGTLTAVETQNLIGKLAAFEQQAGPQIVVLLVPTTQPEDIASFAQRVGETWRIGRRDVGDGLLIVVAKNDRKVWIAPAKALEGAVPDLAARQIVQNQITPRFRQNDFAGGLEAGVDALVARIKGENLPAPSSRDSRDRGGDAPQFGFAPLELLIFAFIALPIIATVLRSVFGRGLGSLAAGAAGGGIAWFVTQSLLLAGIGGVIGFVLALFGGLGSRFARTTSRHHGGWVGGGGWTGGHGGGGWSSGDGGGFSSGGGGDFGGGGAGGDW
jgi:uncharacterized protein